MDIQLNTYQGLLIAELQAPPLAIRQAEDALDLIGNCAYQGAGHIIVREEQLDPAFFDLSTRLAGELLQKFSTYRMSLAIIGDFSKYPGQSLKDFIYESNKTGQICFVSSTEEAIALFLKQQAS
jgi:hypothetical protein